MLYHTRMNKPRLSNELTNIGFLPVTPGNFMVLQLVKADRTVRANFTTQMITLEREGQRSITHEFKDGVKFWEIMRKFLN